MIEVSLMFGGNLGDVPGAFAFALSELERYFPQYLNVINHAIERQREIYQQLLEAKMPQTEKVSTVEKDPKVVS